MGAWPASLRVDSKSLELVPQRNGRGRSFLIHVFRQVKTIPSPVLPLIGEVGRDTVQQTRTSWCRSVHLALVARRETSGSGLGRIIPLGSRVVALRLDFLPLLYPLQRRPNTLAIEWRRPSDAEGGYVQKTYREYKPKRLAQPSFTATGYLPPGVIVPRYAFFRLVVSLTI